MNTEKTIYALYHNHLYDTNLNHYRNLEGADPHKIAIKFLASIALNSLIQAKQEFNKDNFRYAMIQWLFSLVIKDQKIMNIMKIEDNPKIPWHTYFKEYKEENCEYIRLEKDGENINIFFSPLIFDKNSVMFQNFIITMMADRFKEIPVEESIQLVYVFCSELCVIINQLYDDEVFFQGIEDSYNEAMNAVK